MKKQILSEEFKRMQKLAGIQLLNEAIIIPTKENSGWSLKDKLENVHTKPGQGSIFAKSIDDVLKLVQDALDKYKDIDKIANGTGTLTIKSPGIGYNLVLPIDKAKALPGAKESEVEKIEGPNKIKVPAITTTAPLTQFKSDELTIIVRPKKDDKGTVIPNEYIVLSAFPGDPSIPKASEWGEKYAVIIPDGKEELKEEEYYHRGQENPQFIIVPNDLGEVNSDDFYIALEFFAEGEMDERDFELNKEYNLRVVDQSGDEPSKDVTFKFKANGDKLEVDKSSIKVENDIDEIINEALRKYRKLLKENENTKDKIYDFLYSDEIMQDTGVTSFTTCDEDDWEKVKNYINGKGINGITGKQSFLANNEDITEQDFDKYYDEWLDYIEDQRADESRNQQDYNY